MSDDLFSQRYGYRAAEQALVYEDAPDAIRQGLREVLEKCEYSAPSAQRAVICAALRARPDQGNWSEYPNIDQEVDSLLYSLEWWQFYDLCEKLSRKIGPEIHVQNSGTYFDMKLNELFKEEGIGYEIVDGYIARSVSPEFTEAAAAADTALSDADTHGASLEQFRKASSFLNAMPPDYENAVKEAVNSLEGVLQVVTGMHGQSLPSLLSKLDPPLPSKIRKICLELYGYGSGTQGGRHAGIGGYVPGGEEAEFILHCVAAAVRYIASRYA